MASSSSPRLIIKRRQAEAQCFIEQLSQQVSLKMMLIPAGIFMMGSPEDELDRYGNEGPQHEVRISSFFMGKYPITQVQWQVVAGLPQVNRELNPDPSYFKGENHPVESIRWFDAVECCARLSQLTGRDYRLPSEAEWEYACRAGTTTPFHFGETITTELANYRGTDDESMGWSGSYGQGPKGEYREKTTPVDQFGVANAFGLADMHGNVLEWCLDHWHSTYEGAPTDGSVWNADGEDNTRVIRGGSWGDFPGDCRSASRSYNDPGYDFNSFGFRVVCGVP